MTECSLVCTALGSEAAAAQLADTLVQEGLAACVQILGPIHSTYRWKGKVERAEEWLCVAKTTVLHQVGLMARIRALHSYELPEIITIAIADGDPDYLRWLRAEAAPQA